MTLHRGGTNPERRGDFAVGHRLRNQHKDRSSAVVRSDSNDFAGFMNQFTCHDLRYYQSRSDQEASRTLARWRAPDPAARLSRGAPPCGGLWRGARVCVFSTIRFSVSSPWQRAQRATKREAAMRSNSPGGILSARVVLHALDGALNFRRLHGDSGSKTPRAMTLHTIPHQDLAHPQWP